MQRLLIAALAAGLLAVACGSGEESPRETGTATSERIEREATVEEQQAQVAEPEEETAVAEAEVAEEQQVETVEKAEEEDSTEQQAVELPAEIVGVYKGVRSEGRVLGEPDAPVLIEHFGDFT